jgi:SH3 domain-containing protein
MVGRTALRHGTTRALRTLVLVAAATAIAITGSSCGATPAAAAGPKVVIVVGPTNGATATYLTRAKIIAAQARSLGASVTEIYTPKATWARVSAAAQGAKLFVYLGHGSGYPSPYTFDKSKSNGLGLNPTLDSGTTSPVKYYGESLIASSIRFAPGAVVLLSHLCYASGSAEPGMAQPSWAVARQRVDNYAAGFIGAGAGAVIADAYIDTTFEVRAILRGGNMLAAWRANPAYKDHERSFASVRRPGFTNYLDPDGTSSNFYRAITTKPGFTNATPAPLTARTSVAARLRAKPSESATALTTLRKGTSLFVTGRLVSDSKGRTWVPVRTSNGRTGFVAGWLLNFTGTAVPATGVVLRSSASLTAKRILTVAAGSRVTVSGSAKDGAFRVWLKVKTSSGHVGWVAAWLMRP